MIQREALEQVNAGAQIIDIVVSYQDLDEVAAIRGAIKAVMEVTDVPLCVDSPDPAVLEAALSVYEGKMLVSSVNGEEARLQGVLPLVRRYGSAVIALTSDSSGVPGDAQGRLSVARKIVETAEARGFPVRT